METPPPPPTTTNCSNIYAMGVFNPQGQFIGFFTHQFVDTNGTTNIPLSILNETDFLGKFFIRTEAKNIPNYPAFLQVMPENGSCRISLHREINSSPESDIQEKIKTISDFYNADGAYFKKDKLIGNTAAVVATPAVMAATEPAVVEQSAAETATTPLANTEAATEPAVVEQQADTTATPAVTTQTNATDFTQNNDKTTGGNNTRKNRRKIRKSYLRQRHFV